MFWLMQLVTPLLLIWLLAAPPEVSTERVTVKTVFDVPPNGGFGMRPDYASLWDLYVAAAAASKAAIT